MAKQLMKGTEVLAEAAIRLGVDSFFGYPITPQNEIGEYLSTAMIDKGLAFVQAESEVAAANMWYGAAAAGSRTVTSSSSPGVALKQEAISYMAGAELPGLLLSISRSGPGLGGILPSQADYFQSVKGGGNGDYKCYVVAPSNLQEAADIMGKAIEVSEKYRNPAILLADGVIAQMMEPVDLSKLKATPKDKKSFATGRKKEDKRKENNIGTSLYLAADDLEEHNWNLKKKYNEIQKNEVLFEETEIKDAEYVLVAYGSAARIAINAMQKLREEGHKVGLFRPITLWPFPSDALAKATKDKKIMSLELSTGQMIEDVAIATQRKVSEIGFYGRPGGNVFTANEIVEAVKKEFKL